jgi:hypothetical protein
MAAPNEKLAESLDALKALQEGRRRVFRSDELTRVHRERLLENGFLQDVMKGWVISSSPNVRDGDSTPWYALILGILRALLRRTLRRRLVSFAGAVAVAPGRANGRPGPGRGEQPEGHEQRNRSTVRNVAIRPESRGDAGASESHDARRLALVLASGVAGGSGGDFLRAESG